MMSSTSNGLGLVSSHDGEASSVDPSPWQVTGVRLPPCQHASVAEYEIRLLRPIKWEHEEEYPPLHDATALEVAALIVKALANELLPHVQQALIATQGKNSTPVGQETEEISAK